MPLPGSGSISLSQFQTEFGGSNPISVSEYYRLNATNGVYSHPSNTGIPTSGIVSMSNYYGSKLEEIITTTGTITNINLRSMFDAAFGAPSGPVRFRFVNNHTVGASSTSFNALTVGAFPTGSLVTVQNNGSILGAGGSPNSGVGTAAVVANNSGFTTIINNAGNMYGGGGAGGIGGQGGQGFFVAYQAVGASFYGAFGSCNGACVSRYGGGNYCGSGCFEQPEGTNCCPNTECNSLCTTPAQYQCSNCGYNYNVYTSGGAGGTGGRGQGYNHGNLGGSGGGAPGTNAGWGGTGGTGGGWGATGNTGGAGGNGNWTGGLGGGAGGAAGHYLISQGTAVTLNNTGGLLGRVA